MMGATAIFFEPPNRLVAPLKSPPPLGPPGPPPQPDKQASAKAASATDAIRLRQPRTCRVSAPNKTLPLLAAQHRSRQTCRDGTPNPLPRNSFPAPARWRPVAWAGFGPNPAHSERQSGEQDGGNLASVVF